MKVWTLLTLLTMVLGFLTGFFIIKGDARISESPILNGLFGAVVFPAAMAYVVAVVFSWMKGKRGCAIAGAIGFVAPYLTILPIMAVVGAIRIARPNSMWARKYYGPQKMEIARRRFPKEAKLEC